ncbi:MAG TPA: RDD family protein [Candidatus Limnocylindria bacterium]|nr:RDD family protein [Candidatus Limnocylindria bacterium]
MSTNQPGGEPEPASPPAQDWQSEPQQPAQPAQPAPAGGPASSGTPEWVGNLTDQRPVAGPAGFFYADVPNRTIAMVIDVVAMLVIYFVIGMLTLALFGAQLGFGIAVPTMMSQLIGWVITSAIWAGYFIYMWVAMRGTIGMKLLGLQIGHETDGRNLTWEQGAWRFALLFGPHLVLSLLGALAPALGVLGLLGLVWLIYVLVTMAQSPTKQGIHDRYGHSMVVKGGRAVS